VWAVIPIQPNKKKNTVATFHSTFDSAGMCRVTQIGSTEFKGELLYGNSSYYLTSLVFTAATDFEIMCNRETVIYRYSNGECKNSVG